MKIIAEIGVYETIFETRPETAGKLALGTLEAE
jgi:hypothetical protein